MSGSWEIGTATLDWYFFGAVGLLLEPFLCGLDDFINDVYVNLAELAAKVVMNDFIKFSQYFS